MFLANILFLCFPFWGFSAHQDIVLEAVQYVPEQFSWMQEERFREKLKHFAVLPDTRRHGSESENCRHYTDYDHFQNLDSYPDSLLFKGEFGCAIPNLLHFIRKMSWAISNQDTLKIIRLFGEICHYASDICVPLHATENYDGQLTGQLGIHSLWESRLYEVINIESVTPNIHPVNGPYLWATTLGSFQSSILVFKGYDFCLKQVKMPFGFYLRNGKFQKGMSPKFMSCFLHDQQATLVA
ncbi:MAG: hypothetical protein ACJAY8_000884, partial [Sphingobacteriales bacterium]